MADIKSIAEKLVNLSVKDVGSTIISIKMKFLFKFSYINRTYLQTL